MKAARELPELLERARELLAGRARISVASSTSVSIRDSASRSESESAASRCCAPSWRFRSSRRRAASVASTIRERDARSSSSWRFRSLTSTPETSTRATPHWSRIGVAVHATVSSRPSPRDPPRLALRLGDAVRGARDRHPCSELVVARDDLEERPPARAPRGCARRRRRTRGSRRSGTTFASWSVMTMKLGIVSATVFAKSRWRWRSTSRRLRSVMSIPPAMIRTTSPLSSTSGAERQAITRSLPRASVNAFSYSAGANSGAAARKRCDHLLALGGIDEDVPEVRALEPAAVVVVPARDLHRAVEVPDPALRVDDGEQARCGVDDGLEEPVLRTELGLQSLLLEGERGGRCNGVDEVALVGRGSGRRAARQRACRRARRTSLPSRCPASGSLSVRPSSSTHACRSVDQYARSSDGSPSASASASRSGVPFPSAIARSAIPARASRVRRMPIRNAIGISASDASARCSSHERRRLAERPHDAARHQRRQRLEGEEVHGADDAAKRRRRSAVPAHEPDEQHAGDRRPRRARRRSAPAAPRRAASEISTAFSGQSAQSGIGVGSKSASDSGPSTAIAATASTSQRSSRGSRPVG